MNDEVSVGAGKGAPYRVKVTSVSHISARRFAEILSAIKTTDIKLNHLWFNLGFLFLKEIFLFVLTSFKYYDKTL